MFPDRSWIGSLGSRQTALHLVIGVVERDGGTLYCTVLFFSPESYLGKHRKLMPTAAERVWSSVRGRRFPCSTRHSPDRGDDLLG